MKWISVLPRTWQKYWFHPRPLLNLAFCRILFVLTQLIYLIGDNYYSTLTQSIKIPDNFYHPLPVLQILTLSFGSHYRPDLTVLILIFWLTLLTGLSSLIGWKTRISLFLFAYGNLFIQSYVYSFGQIHHSSSLMLIALAVFAFSPAGEVLSIDDWQKYIRARKQRASFDQQQSYFSSLFHRSSPLANWPLLLMQWMFAFTYLSAAFSKLKSGLEWMNGYTLQYYMMAVGGQWNKSEFAFWLSQHHHLAILFSWISVIWELTFFLVLIFPRLKWIYLPLGVGFHTGIYIVFGLNFFRMIVLYAVFIPWTTLLQKIFPILEHPKFQYYSRKLLIRRNSLKKLYGDQINREIIIPARTIDTSETLDMNIYSEAKKINLQGNTYTTPDAYVVNLHNVLYDPYYRILLSHTKQIITDSINISSAKSIFSWQHIYFSPVIELKGSFIIFRSSGTITNYYHTVLDNVPRLYLLTQSGFLRKNPIQLLMSSPPTQVEQFFLDRMLPDNVQITLLNSTQKLYKLESLIYASFLTRRLAAYLPQEYQQFLMASVAPKRPRKKQHRILISRVDTDRGSRRCILNEDSLFEQLKFYGFERYILENLSIEEQIELFYDAEFVIGSHGAGLSNLMYSQRIKVIELFPTQYVLTHYYYLCKSLGHSYRYWCGSMMKQSDRNRNFKVDVDQVLSLVKELDAIPKD